MQAYGEIEWSWAREWGSIKIRKELYQQFEVSVREKPTNYWLSAAVEITGRAEIVYKESSEVRDGEITG